MSLESNMAEKDDEVEDPVVEELDVYLSKDLMEHLYLFQYPVRPAAVTYDKMTVLAAKVKPKQEKVMLEIFLDTSQPSYVKSKGEQIALEADHAAPDDKKLFKSGLMDKQVLVSTKSTMPTSQYAAGLLKDGEIHLTPLKGVLQLRPCFDYLDHGKERQPSSADEGESQDEDEEKPTALLVRFAKKETEQQKAQRLSSYKHHEKQLAEEPWTDVDFYGINHPNSIEERKLLYCQEMDTEVLEFDPSPSNYWEKLMPSPVEVASKEKSHIKFTTMAHIRTLDLIDQVKAYLMKAKVLRFNEICNLIHPKPDNEKTLLKCLQQYAVLVQGSWVVKSELLYPKGTTSAFSSSTSETLCRARDYILYKFTQSRTVRRDEIVSVVKLSIEDVNDIVQQVAVRGESGWEFKFPDEDFVQRFGDVVKHQMSFWTTRYKALCDKYKFVDEDDIDIKSPTSETLPSGTSRHINPASDVPMDTDVECTDEEKLFDRLVKFVKDKLHTGTLSLAEMKRLLLLHPVAGSPGDIRTPSVSDALLLRAIAKCGGEEIDLKWPATSQYPADLNSRRIFVVRELGNPLDKYRGVAVDLFNGAFSLQRKKLMEKSKQVLGSAPTTTEYNKVIQELGLEKRGASWFVRGTQPLSDRTR